MVTRNESPSKEKTLTPRARIAGLTHAARSLGVSRTHLSLVLHGHRESKSLTKRYEKLIAGN